MQPNNNRTPGQTGESNGQDVDQAAFKPGDSFTDEPSDQDGSGELPSWLRNFAGATGDSTDAAKPAAQADSPGEQAHPLAAEQSPRPSPEPAVPSASFEQQPGGDAGFFSEDDLPEWLRALSADSEPAASAAPVAAVAASTVTPNGAIPVPPVTRAWVTASDVPEVSTGANLLSSLVHAIDSRPDIVAVDVPAPAPPNAKSAAKPKAAAPVASEPTPAATTAATVSEAATNQTGRWSRTRILAIAAIIVLLLLIIVLQFGN